MVMSVKKSFTKSDSKMVAALLKLPTRKLAGIKAAVAEGQAEALLDVYRTSVTVDDWRNHLIRFPPSAEVIGILLDLIVEQDRSQRGRKASEARHTKSGGTLERKVMLQAEWLTGKYDTKERCISENYEAFGISRSTADKALRPKELEMFERNRRRLKEAL